MEKRQTMTGDNVIQPLRLSGVHPVTVVIIPGEGATGKLQYSTRPWADVKADNADWQDWVAGDVSERTEDVIVSPVTAIKPVKSSGDSLSWEVLS